MNEQEILQIFEETGACIRDTHVVYSSGKHGSDYINKDAIFKYPNKISKLCQVIAAEFANDKVEVVIGPVIGGIIIAQWVTMHLSKITGDEVLSIYAEKAENEDRFLIKRGYDKVLPGRNTLVVEDILTTGTSAKKVIEIVRKLGANIVGLAALWNRGRVSPEEVGNPPKFFTLVNIKFPAWDPGNCPLCMKGIPINTEIGRGWQK